MTTRFSYGFLVTHIYDADNVGGELDKGFFEYERGKNGFKPLRFYGINMQEIRRSSAKGIGDAEVAEGYDQRDALIRMLDNDPTLIPRTAKYHKLPNPVMVDIDTIKDADGVYGRLLGIVNYKGENLNENLRDIVGGVNFYDGKTYPPDYPIRAPI